MFGDTPDGRSERYRPPWSRCRPARHPIRNGTSWLPPRGVDVAQGGGQNRNMSVPSSSDNVGPPLRGLLHGFEAYLSVSQSETRAAIRDGLVVLDANVLLNLYRYDDGAREDLFRLLQALGDRLFVPHQVATEFWRNRASASRERLKMAGDTVERLEELGKNADKVLREWANRLAIADNVRETLLGALSGSFESVIGVVEPSEGALSETSHSETSKDPILLRLESILVDKVGPPFSEDDLRTNVKEGHRRVDAENTPRLQGQGQERRRCRR